MENNIRYTNSISSEINQYLSQTTYTKLYVLVDENTVTDCYPLLKLPAHTLIHSKSGEQNKTITSLNNIWTQLSENGADRKAVLINLGGGLLSDLGGFAASCFKRGIRFLNIPTTLLAQVDASVGGKTGINLNSLKNEIGVFNTPQAVFIDTVFLKTLDKDEFLSGTGEMLKHGIIRSAEHLEKVMKHDFSDQTNPQLLPLVEQSVAIKSYFVENDFTENSIRKALNFAHTTAHAFETFSHKRELGFKHGEMVAHGIVVEALLSNKKLGLDVIELNKLIAYIKRNFRPFQIEESDIDEILGYMTHDKKNLGGRINFTLIKRIGEFKIDCYLEVAEIQEVLKEYIQFHSDLLQN